MPPPCDSIDGPVVKAAIRALDEGSVVDVLWSLTPQGSTSLLPGRTRSAAFVPFVRFGPGALGKIVESLQGSPFSPPPLGVASVVAWRDLGGERLPDQHRHRGRVASSLLRCREPDAAR